MSGIEFVWDSRDLEVFRGGKIEKALGRSMRLAGNQAIKVLQQGTVKLVLSRKNLSQVTVTEDQSLDKPRRSDQLQDFVWRLWIKGKPVPVAKFPMGRIIGAKGRGGIFVAFGGGHSMRIKGGFLATMKSGHVGVFKRTGKGRLPIAEVFSSRLPKGLGGEVMMTLGESVYRKLETSFKRGLDRELGKLRRKGDA